jgi:general secretion pathway protein H
LKSPLSNHRFLLTSQRGFTFFELIVVMILLVFAGSLVYVSVGRSMNRNQGKMFTREMAAMIKKARISAISQGLPVMFHVSSSERHCWIHGDDHVLDIPEDILIEGEGIQYIDNDIHAIYFYPDGSSSGGTLSVLSNGQVLYMVRVDMLTGILTPLTGHES